MDVFTCFLEEVLTYFVLVCEDGLALGVHLNAHDCEGFKTIYFLPALNDLNE